MKANRLESALEKVSRIVTDRYGLRLICQGNGCRTNGKTIYLPSLPEDVPEELLGAIRGWADHECAHAIHTQPRAGKAFKEQHGLQAFNILNVLEDARVERLLGSRYPGARLNLEEGFQFVVDRVQKGQARKVSPFDEFVTALYTRGAGKPDQAWLPPDAYRLADECRDEISELRSCRRTTQVGALALRIWDKVMQAFPPRQREARGPSSSEEASQGALSSQEENQDASHRPTEPRAAVGGGQGAANPAPQHLPEPSGLMEQLGSLIETELTALYSGNPAPYRPYTTEYDQVEVPEPEPGFDYRREMEQLRPYVAGLRRRLLQTLMAERESLWLGDRTRGKLDPRALHRLLTSSSNRVFRKRVESQGKDTACTLLLDISSSMNGPSIQLCQKLALVFAESLDVLGFPTEVIGFSTVDMDLRPQVAAETGLSEDELAKRFARFVPLYHAIYKGFDEPWRKVAGRIGKMSAEMLTPLGESLLFAGRRLAARPEKRKVLFCLTDGKPVVGAWDERITFNHACEAVKKLSSVGIEPVGIGILESSVTEIFPRHAVIRDLSELPSGFLRQLCSVLAGASHKGSLARGVSAGTQ